MKEENIFKNGTFLTEWLLVKEYIQIHITSPFIKVNSKYIKDFNIKPDILNLMGEKVENDL